MLTIKLPMWMWERIVDILSKHNYTGAAEIVRAIKAQTVPAMKQKE